MRWLLALVLLAAPAYADMFPDAKNAKLPEAQVNLGVAAVSNPATFDALCDGRTVDAEITAGTAHDCSAAINSAAAVTVNGMAVNVQLQPGKYYLTNTVSLLAGQTLIGAGRAKTHLKVRDTFNPAAQGVVALAPSAADNGQFGGLRDLTISFSQPLNQTSRANFQLLGTCTSNNAGTGCKYPPAVLLSSGRAFFDRVRIEKAWDGIASNSVGTINSPGGTGTSTVNLHDVQMSAINTGLWIDGTKDTSYLERFHFWSYGFAATDPIYGVFTDGSTDCLRLGDMDGFDAVNVFCHGTNMHFIPSAVNAGDAIGAAHMTNVTLDHGGRFIFEGANNLTVTNMLQSGFPVISAPPNCSLTVNSATRPGDRLMVVNYWVQNHTETPVCVYKGALHLEHARIITFTDRPSVLVDGGPLYLRNANWAGSGGTPRTAPVIWVKTGTLILSGQTMTPPTAGGGGVALQIDTNSAHTVLDTNWGGYGVSLGCGAATAGYCWGAAPLGSYDMPDYPFAMVTTPTILGSTDFAPINRGTAGSWWLRGNKVEFWLREEFDSNAYTTGTNFSIATTMPPSGSGLGRSCTLSRFDKVAAYTVPPYCGLLNNTGGTATQVNFGLPVPGAGQLSLTRAANMLPSVANYLFFLQGWYPVR